MLHIQTKFTPVESAHFMSILERYHGLNRHAFNIVCKETPDVDKENALQMAVKAVNISVYFPDGLIPTLVLFGDLPRLDLSTEALSPSNFKRPIALRKVTTEISKHFASRKVRNSLKSRNGPDVTKTRSTPSVHPVLAYRPGKDRWEGS